VCDGTSNPGTRDPSGQPYSVPEGNLQAIHDDYAAISASLKDMGLNSQNATLRLEDRPYNPGLDTCTIDVMGTLATFVFDAVFLMTPLLFGSDDVNFLVAGNYAFHECRPATSPQASASSSNP
jgi:hypothetical protein